LQGFIAKIITWLDKKELMILDIDKSFYKNIMKKIEIKDEEMLFDILVNQKEKYSQLQEIEFCNNFINSIEFSVKIEGKTLENTPIKGHITTDLLNICNAWQNTIYSIYAGVVKGRDDARGRVLTKEEREQLTLVFKIKEGSTKEIVENIPQIINSFRRMPLITQLTLIGACSIIAIGGIYYVVNKDNNDKIKFLAQNTTLDNAIKTLERTTIEALNSSKLHIEKATIGKTELDRQQIQNIADEMNNEENDVEEKISANFVVTKLYHKGSKKMATLTNKDYVIESGFTKNLFENNETTFMNSYSKGVEIGCEVYIEKDSNGMIKKATLLKVLQPNNSSNTTSALNPLH
jgi:hypothetical protein